jgi:hypothetical protein
MVDLNYRVRLTTQTVQHVIASTVQLLGDHLVFVNSKGQLTAPLLKDSVRKLEYAAHIVPVLRCSVAARALSQFLNLVFLRSDGSLATLFDLKIVACWSRITSYSA